MHILILVSPVKDAFLFLVSFFFLSFPIFSISPLIESFLHGLILNNL